MLDLHDLTRPSVVVQTRLPRIMAEILDKMAELNRISRSEMIRFIISDWMVEQWMVERELLQKDDGDSE